jgi:hypothetical protein
VAIRDRFVEVLADRGASAIPRWSAGSGFLVGGRYVLTAAHVVAAGSVYVRRLGAEPGEPKKLWPAQVVLCGDVDVADIALAVLEEDPGPLPPVSYARVDRNARHTAVVDGCTVVGFPEFKKRGPGATAPRETVQLDGAIPTSEDLGSGLLSLRVQQPQPRPLPPEEEALGRSPWSGISGAAALVGGRVVGIVSEHHPRAGSSALTLVPITFIDRLPDAARWWSALGADRARIPAVPQPDRRRVGELPVVAEHYQSRGYGDELWTAMLDSEVVVLSPERDGLGGVGMTQLAAELARRLWDSEDIDLLVWSRASDRDQVLKSYQEAAGAVEAEDFLGWLETTHQRWLVVLDDLIDRQHLVGLWPPVSRHGRVVVTTRAWHASSGDTDDCYRAVGRVEVGPFTAAEAIAYLRASLDCEEEEAAELARVLSFQPVALAEAASYIRAKGLDCAQYRQRFAERQLLLPRMLAGGRQRADVQRSAVTVAWSLGVEKLPAPDARVPLSRARYQMTNGTQTMTLEVDGTFTQEILDKFFPSPGIANG